MIILRVLARRLRLAGRLGLLAVTSCLLAATAQARDTVLVLGDSISAAYGMQLEQGWVSLLDARLQKEQPTYRVINASISGETSGGGLRRLPDLLSEHAPKVVIIELGGNDGLRGYPVKQLRDNLKQLIRLSEEAAARVLLLPMEIPPNFGKFYTDAFRASFTEATENSMAILAEFPLASVALEPTLMQTDGIHPTAEAQPIILESVWQTLESML
ncbi:MAG: arylesterase [Halieaceae bacterium]